MSADGSIELPLGGELRRFRLAIGELRELQDVVNRPRVAAGAAAIGIGQLIQGLRDGGWWVEDFRDTIRLGLLGGGLDQAKTFLLIKRYVDPPNPTRANVLLARAILISATMGVPDDDVGKAATEKRKDPSASPSSMASEGQSDGALDKSMTPASGS